MHCLIVPGPEGLGDGSNNVLLPVGGSLLGWQLWLDQMRELSLFW